MSNVAKPLVSAISKDFENLLFKKAVKITFDKDNHLHNKKQLQIIFFD